MAVDRRAVLGPRKQRRLVAGVAVAVVVGVIAAVVLSTRSTSATNPDTGASTRAMGQAGTYPTYGMTPRQVELITGRPARIQGRCWVFRPKAGTANGLPTRSVGTMLIGDPGSIAARSNGLLKLCFYDGLFSTASKQIRLNGEWVWREFSPGGPVTSSCQPCTPP